MARKNDWTALPEVVTAFRDVLAHYNLLGCPPGSSRLDSLIANVEGPSELRTQFRNAQAALASHPRHPEAITALARVTWAAFNEPTLDTLRTIDQLGLAESFAVPVSGSFGRLWCRRITDAAWTVWTLAYLHDPMVRYISLDKDWLEEFQQ